MRDTQQDQPANPSRLILTAELLAIGTELTVGETNDSNTGEIARSLTAHGVEVRRISKLPDDLDLVRDAIGRALTRADLIVTTGGLGPTPDDLTREAVAAACGQVVEIDQATLDWLRGLWARRRQPFPEGNVKQAWRIPAATILPNPNGTAPGWWVDRPDGRVIVTLPGPPREMRPMWTEQALPRLSERGVGVESEVRTLRLTGIGESQVADLLGEPLLRATNPIVATYARHEAVDVRISGRTTKGATAAALVDEAERAVLTVVGPYVWARGDSTWAAAIDEALQLRGWTIATVERGTGGALVSLLGALAARQRAEVVDHQGDEGEAPSREAARELATRDAERIRAESGADVGMAVLAARVGDDTAAHIVVVTPEHTVSDRRIAFLRGAQGRDRAAIAAASVLLEAIRPAAGGNG